MKIHRLVEKLLGYRHTDGHFILVMKHGKIN